MKLFLLEPEPTAAWSPFAGVRPVAELRAGVWLIRERWEDVLGAETEAIFSESLAGFTELDAPVVRPSEEVPGPAVVASSTFAPALGPTALEGETRRLVHDDRTVAWVVPAGEVWRGPSHTGATQRIDGLWLDGVAQLLDSLEGLLLADCAALGLGREVHLPAGSVVLGDPAQAIIDEAAIEPGVVFDVRQGPVVIDVGAEIRHGSRLEGPLYVGPQTIVLGGALKNSVFGPQCRVRGEVSHSIFVGFSNKAHDGFIGHSVVGQWVNLGALSTTSNLKNTYGEIRLQVENDRLDTGRQFLGSLIGDHAKTAIGTMLGTGTVVSVGANLFGANPVPPYVPPFAWGNGKAERMTEDGFLQVAERVFPRRGVAWTVERESWLRTLYRRTAR